MKRRNILNGVELKEYPSDPKKGQLTNYISTYKNNNARVYNPTPYHLKSWCKSHDAPTVNVDIDASCNTPFVLGYILVNVRSVA